MEVQPDDETLASFYEGNNVFNLLTNRIEL